MNDFFKKHLTNYTPAEDGWNVPSDKMWDTARVHFPQKEKKRQSLLYILFGCFIGLTTLAIYLNAEDNRPVTTQATNVSSSINKSNQAVITSKITKEQKEILQNTKTNHTTNHITNSTKALLNDTPLALPQSSALKQKSTPHKPSGYQQQTNINNTLITEVKNYSPKISLQENTSLDLTKPSERLKEKHSKTQDLGISSSPIINNQAISSVSSQQNTKPRLDNLSGINKLTLLPYLSNFSIKSDRASTNGEALTYRLVYKDENPRKKPFSKPISMGIKGYEIGLSRSLNLLTLIGIVNVSESNNDITKLEIFSRNLNLNLNYAKLISKRFSFTAQAQMSTLDMNLSFVDEHSLTTDQFDWSINDDLSQVVTRENIIENNNNIKIELEEGLSLKEGDQVIVNAQATIKARALQLPIMFNIHAQNRRRTEFYLGIGGSLDYIKLKVNIGDLEILKDNIVVNKTHTYSLYEENYYMINLYNQAGMKVHISPHINLGLQARVSILRPEFSGLEVGIFYRWSAT